MSEANQIARECHGLIEQIRRRPYSVKLLTVARRGLLIVAQYKANRGRSLSRSKTS